MKKLSRKATVHPSPAIKPDDKFLSLLPITILSLVASLSAEDREVLTYLISTSSFKPNRIDKTKKSNDDHHHSPSSRCDCFSCYTSYWVRWDSSPSREEIHKIIDAYEESLVMKKKKKKNRRKGYSRVDSGETSRISELGTSSAELCRDDSVEDGEAAEKEKGSVEKIISFIGQKVIGLWG